MTSQTVRRRWSGWLLGGVVLSLLPGCVTSRAELSWARKEFGTEEVGRSGFWHCSGHACRFKNKIEFSEAEWARVKEPFAGASDQGGGADERARLRKAVATLEIVVGEKTGTRADLGGSFGGFGKNGQMDCVDEMLNVATYVDLLIKEGLVTKHRLGRRYTNQLFKTGGWPHTATSIVDLSTGEEFVVDSWWLKNGNLPYIVPLGQWTEGEWDRPVSAKSKRAREAAAGQASS